MLRIVFVHEIIKIKFLKKFNCDRPIIIMEKKQIDLAFGEISTLLYLKNAN